MFIDLGTIIRPRSLRPWRRRTIGRDGDSRSNIIPKTVGCLRAGPNVVTKSAHILVREHCGPRTQRLMSTCCSTPARNTAIGNHRAGVLLASHKLTTCHMLQYPRAGKLLPSHKINKDHMWQHPRTRHRNGHPRAGALLALDYRIFHHPRTRHRYGHMSCDTAMGTLVRDHRT